MRKYLMVGKIVLGLSLCIILAGCGAKEKKLVCKQSISGVDLTFTTNFSGNVLKSMDVLYSMDLSSYSDSIIESVNKQDFCTKVKEAFKEYGNAFENCKQNIVEKKLNVTADFNISKLSNNVLDTIGSPDKTKTELESDGYSCTLE